MAEKVLWYFDTHMDELHTFNTPTFQNLVRRADVVYMELVRQEYIPYSFYEELEQNWNDCLRTGDFSQVIVPNSWRIMSLLRKVQGKKLIIEKGDPPEFDHSDMLYRSIDCFFTGSLEEAYITSSHCFKRVYDYHRLRERKVGDDITRTSGTVLVTFGGAHEDSLVSCVNGETPYEVHHPYTNWGTFPGKEIFHIMSQGEDPTQRILFQNAMHAVMETWIGDICPHFSNNERRIVVGQYISLPHDTLIGLRERVLQRRERIVNGTKQSGRRNSLTSREYANNALRRLPRSVLNEFCRAENIPNVEELLEQKPSLLEGAS